MSHASQTAGGGGSAGEAGGETAREANLLGAATLAVGDRLAGAVEAAAGRGGAAPAALSALASHLDGCSIEEFRRSLGLTHSATVRLADRLAADGLVRREPGRDGRSVSLRITPAGLEGAERVREARGRALDDLLDPLTATERATLGRLHGKLLAALTGGRADAARLCRLCDAGACGHPARCPVTRAADRAEASRPAA